MYDESGRTRVQLFAADPGPGRGSGPGLRLLYRSVWRPGVTLKVSEWPEGGQGNANLVLTCEEDGTRAGIHVSGDSGARLELRDGDGRTIWSRP